MTWVEPEQWYAQLASFYAAAAALITDTSDRVLLVKPNYRDHWALPGGYVDQQESPQLAVAREVGEELGLDLAVGSLLVVDWASSAGVRPRPIISFLFDGGALDRDAKIVLNGDELEDFGFFTVQECQLRLPSSVAPRVPAAMAARSSGIPAYLLDTAPFVPHPGR